MEKLDGRSKDIIGENIEKMKALFPEVFTEGKVDFEQLQTVLGEYVDDRDERYRFEWHGKSQALRLSQTPSTGTLRPCKKESKNWDTTQNLYIEGDNLEVLKLLQKSYHNKVKMIYIDPPYNTGKDFVYPDNYKDNLQNYLEITGQLDEEGKKVSTNSEGSGRYHTDWLNMMYPRLRLARNLLTDDGVIFISIDDNESSNLKKICDEVFGEVNFVEQIPWIKRVSPANDSKWYSGDHEFVLIYAKSKIRWYPNRTERTGEHDKYYKNPDNDPRGPWNSAAYTCNKSRSERPNLYYPIVNPYTNEEIYPNENAVWAYSKGTHEQNVRDNLLYWGANGRSQSPRKKKFLFEAKKVVPRSFWHYSKVGSTQTATTDLRELFDGASFTYPKPVSLLEKIIYQTTRTDTGDIVLDFFSGSSTTAHAVINRNIKDGGNRKFIMVQLPEKTDKKSEAHKAGYKNICEIGKERIRRAGEKIVVDNQDKEGIEELDIGFKVFKLDSSNLKKWNPDYEELWFTLDAMVNNYVVNRTEEDVLYEIMLKFGVDLTYPIDEFKAGGKKIFSIGFGALFACLAADITVDVAEAIVQKRDELQPEITRVVFKDNGFSNDSVKVNALQVLKRNGITEVMSV